MHTVCSLFMQILEVLAEKSILLGVVKELEGQAYPEVIMRSLSLGNFAIWLWFPGMNLVGVLMQLL